MPTSHFIDSENRLIEYTINGSISEKEYNESLALIRSDPRYNYDYNKLLDIRKGSINLATEDRYQFTKRQAAVYKNDPSRFAIIAEDPVEIAHGMLFGSVLERDNARVFPTREAALQWLCPSN